MTRARLHLANLRHHAAGLAPVALAIALTAAVITGALVVGDSVEGTLARRVERRLAGTESVLDTGERPVREALAAELAEELRQPVGAVVRRDAVASVPDSGRRAGRIVVLGVDGLPASGVARDVTPAFVNSRAAARLGVRPGDEVVLRFQRPSALPLESTLTAPDAAPVTLRVTIVEGTPHLAELELASTPAPPANVLVPRAALQAALGWQGRANLLLIPRIGAAEAQAALKRRWKPHDAGLRTRVLPDGPLQLDSAHVFLPGAVAGAMPVGTRLLTWMADEIRHGENAAPYSMVTGLSPGGPQPGHAILNEWCAGELRARAGSTIALRYRAVDRADQLVERTAEFLVERIVGTTMLDPAMTPELPGISDRASCRDWDTNLSIDVGRLRPRDEKYWELHRGTPKVVLALDDARKLFGSRFGDTTAVRFTRPPFNTMQFVESNLRERVDPAAVGLSVRDAGGEARRSVSQALSFRGLFLALSSFLIAAALALAALLFGFHLERRTRELGLLAAVGLPPGTVRAIVKTEALLVALPSAALGVAAGIAYTGVLLHALGGAWSGALAGSPVTLHVRPLTLAISWVVSVAAVMAAVSVVMRGAGSRALTELLSGRSALPAAPGATERTWTRPVPLVLALAAAVALFAAKTGHVAVPVACLTAAALLLVAGVIVVGAWLRTRAGASIARDLPGLAVRGLARRAGRGQAVAGILACGTFLLVVLESQRLSHHHHGSGTGSGPFAVWLSLTRPIGHDLATREGRSAAGYEGHGELEWAALRVVDGDDASCLNLGRAQSPRVLGVPSKRMQPGWFRFASGRDWSALPQPFGPGEIPGLADLNTLTYALGRSIGDVLEYRDEAGKPLRIRIVGALDNSIFQGAILVDEAHVRAHWPVRGTPRAFLLSSLNPHLTVPELERRFADHGAEALYTSDILERFAEVQNTYISIFQVLGALGLLLGSAGLGVMLAAGALERRGELALLRAVGFPLVALRRLLVLEHAHLFRAGLAVGVVTAALAIAPLLASHGGRISGIRTALLVAALLVAGGLWIGLAARLALPRDLLRALRRE